MSLTCRSRETRSASASRWATLRRSESYSITRYRPADCPTTWPARRTLRQLIHALSHHWTAHYVSPNTRCPTTGPHTPSVQTRAAPPLDRTPRQSKHALPHHWTAHSVSPNTRCPTTGPHTLSTHTRTDPPPGPHTPSTHTHTRETRQVVDNTTAHSI